MTAGPNRGILAAAAVCAALGATARAQTPLGWPVYVGAPNSPRTYVPTLADIDGDGAAEIFVNGGETIALRADGSPLAGWPARDVNASASGSGVMTGPSVGDLDADGAPDVLWALHDWFASGPLRLWAFNARARNGQNLAGFPQAAAVEGASIFTNALVPGDARRAGFVAAAAATIGSGYHVTFFSAGGRERRVIAMPAGEWVNGLHFGDLDGDGREEFFAVTISNVEPGTFWLHAFDEEGREQPGSPKRLITAPQGLATVAGNSVATRGATRGLDVRFAYFGDPDANIDCFHYDGSRCGPIPLIMPRGTQIMRFVFGNLQGGTSPAQAIAINYDRFSAVYGITAIDVATRATMPGWPVTLPKPASVTFPGAPVVFDANGDGFQDVAVVFDNALYVYSDRGVLLPGYPRLMRSRSSSGAAVGDVDGDGFFDIVAVTEDGWAYVWKTQGPASPDRASWPMRASNARNTAVYRGSSAAPSGVFDAPGEGGPPLSGAVAFGGWALDDSADLAVAICRAPVFGIETVNADARCGGNAQVFIGDAAFVEGARPDVKAIFPRYPYSGSAGWGLMVLTNVLPDIPRGLPTGGNGTFQFSAYARDQDGHVARIGQKTILCDNTQSVRPFGTIDTPLQGATVSGTIINFGWALTPRPAAIPLDGSTIDVYIDGMFVGHPAYNNFRSDIAGAFPGLANANGAVGHVVIDTTRLANGVHTIGWMVRDDAGHSEGIGSRFFTVSNP